MTLEDTTRERRFQSLETERNRTRYEYQSKIATFTSVHAPGHCIYQAVLAMFGLKHAGRLHSLAGWHAAGGVPRLRARTVEPGMFCHPVMADAARSGEGASAALLTNRFAQGQGHAPRRRHVSRPPTLSTGWIEGWIALNVTVYTLHCPFFLDLCCKFMYYMDQVM